MIDKEPIYSADVIRLMDMDREMITAKDIAKIVRMHPSVINHYAKTGQWNLGRYIISGSHVKFFRIDFLRAGGWIQ
jgi:hypothetical protein